MKHSVTVSVAAALAVLAVAVGPAALARPKPAMAADAAVVAPAASTSDLTRLVEAAALPQALVAPSSADAGIGQSITITGTGFGSTLGTVRFPSGSGGEDIAATVIESWSNTKIVCQVPRRAESGAATIYAAGGSSATGPAVATFSLAVGFSFSGSRASSPFSFTITENTKDMSGEGDAIRRAMATWSASGANFEIIDAGAPGPDTPQTGNGRSEIYFVPDIPGVTVAKNYRGYDSAGRITECDIYIDDSVAWGAGASASFTDLESVVLHELGHTVGLDDQYDDYTRGEVMGLTVVGQTRHELSPAEKAGAIWIYGSSPTPPTDPLPASLTVAGESSLVPAYAAQAYVAVRLKSASGTPLSEKAVQLYRSTGAKVATLVESEATPGTYCGYAPLVDSRAVFSARFEGDDESGSAGLSVIVTPKAKLSVNAPETPGQYKGFYVSGTLSPAHDDAAVKFEAWRRNSAGDYYLYRTKTATTSAAQFRKSFYLPAGRYRFRTVHSDATHAYSKSGWDYITVTK